MCERLNEVSLVIQHMLFVPAQSHFPRVSSASTDVPNFSHLRVTSLSQEFFGDVNVALQRGLHFCIGICVCRAPDLEVADADVFSTLDGTGEKSSDILNIRRGAEVVVGHHELAFKEYADLNVDFAVSCDFVSTDDPGEVPAAQTALRVVPDYSSMRREVLDNKSVVTVECDGTVMSTDAFDWAATVVLLRDTDIAVFGSSNDDSMSTVAFLVESELQERIHGGVKGLLLLI